MPRPTSRRDFLTGRSAVDALAELRTELGPALPKAAVESPLRSWLVSITREAMACEFEVLLNARQYPAGPDAAVAALDLVEQLESQLTIYRETSEVSRLNARAFAREVIVEVGLFGLLSQAKELFAATAGALDITAGPLSRVWGFHRRQGRMPSPDDVREALARVGCESLQLDETTCGVRFLKEGMEVNLGAIGKGFTLDRCADLLENAGIKDFLIHGGMSSVLARGSREGQTDNQQVSKNQDGGLSDESIPSSPQPPTPSSHSASWSVGLRHPLRPDVRLAEFYLQNQALGTSGSGTQFFHHQGKRYGHILDPRTGWPAEQVLSATVIAPSAALADALSTAFYVLGREGAQTYCQEHSEISALLIQAAGRGTQVEMHPINLPDEAWRILPIS